MVNVATEKNKLPEEEVSPVYMFLLIAGALCKENQ
jgi:hypothetical protein